MILLLYKQMIHTFVYIKLKYSNNFHKNKSPKLLVNHCHKIKKDFFQIGY